MPGATPIYGFPYPLGTDPVAQGDNVIRSLAEDVETVIDGVGDYVNVVGQSFNNFTIGNGTIVSRYARVGNFVHFYGYVTLGSTSSMTGVLRLALPFTSVASSQNNPSSAYFLFGSPPFSFVGTAMNYSTTELSFFAHNSTSTFASMGQVGPSVPFSWTTGNAFAWNHIYQAV